MDFTVCLTIVKVDYFKTYPFDWQICPLEMESYGYKTDDLTFSWDETLPPIDISAGIRLPNHRIRGHFVNSTPKHYETGEFTSLSG